MLIKTRGRIEIDITPANWPPPAGVPMFAAWAAVIIPLNAEDLEPDLREFVGLFCDIRLGVESVTATVILPAHLSDDEIEKRRKSLVRLTQGAGAVVEFASDGSAKLIESRGPVSLGTRLACSAGHAATEGCEHCRGVCLGGLDYPPETKPLPASTLG